MCYRSLFYSFNMQNSIQVSCVSKQMRGNKNAPNVRLTVRSRLKLHRTLSRSPLWRRRRVSNVESMKAAETLGIQRLQTPSFSPAQRCAVLCKATALYRKQMEQLLSQVYSCCRMRLQTQSKKKKVIGRFRKSATGAVSEEMSVLFRSVVTMIHLTVDSSPC